MSQCSRCGDPIPDSAASTCAINELEAEEFRGEVRLGEVLCAVCFHRIKWPKLFQNKQSDDDMPDLTEFDL